MAFRWVSVAPLYTHDLYVTRAYGKQCFSQLQIYDHQDYFLFALSMVG